MAFNASNVLYNAADYSLHGCVCGLAVCGAGHGIAMSYDMHACMHTYYYNEIFE